MRRLSTPNRGALPLPSVALVAAALLGLACGGKAGQGDPGRADPVVGPDGGTVTEPSGATVVVPPGAISADVTIRIEKDSSGAPPLPTGLAGAGDTYVITPHGGDFAAPVEVRIPAPAVTLQPNQELKLAKAQPGGEWVVLGDSQLKDGVLSAPVSSFSFFLPVKLTYSQPVLTIPPLQVTTSLSCGLEHCLFAYGPVTATFTVTANGGALPAGCGDGTLQIFENGVGHAIPPTGASVTRNVLPGGGQVAPTYSPYMFTAGVHCPTLGITVIQGDASVVWATPLGFPHTSIVGYGVPDRLDAVEGRTAKIEAVFTGGAAVFQSGRYRSADGTDSAVVDWERSDDGGKSWRTVATSYQFEGNPDPGGTGYRWQWWSVQHAFIATAADQGALIRTHYCYAPPPAIVPPGFLPDPCGYGFPTRITVLQQSALPAIVDAPRSVLVTTGQTASFSATASGLPAPTLQWQTRPANSTGAWADVTTGAGATTASYTTAALVLADNGRQYRVVATNSVGTAASSPATASVSDLDVAPTITTQPASLSVTEGSDAAFAVAARGTEALSYQWRREGTPIPGANGPVLRLGAVTFAAAGDYDAVVSNAAGSATSAVATLTVTAGAPAPVAPTIVTQPASVSVGAGNTATFAVGASGTGPLGFQWRKDGSDLAGATSAALTLAAVTASDAGVYSVVVSNAAGSVTSANASLELASAPPPIAPTITTQPATLVVAPGAAATLAVAASGSGPLAYQWALDGTPVPGATDPVLHVASVTALEAGSYTVTVGNAAGTVASSPALLVLLGAPAITTQPAGASVAEGATASFSVGASGSGLRYQWLRNGVAIPGAVAASYTTPALALADSGAVFAAIVYNGAGAAVSSPAVLTVTPVVVARAWSAPALLEFNDVGHATRPQIALNAGGNGMAVWQHAHDDILLSIWASRYTAGSGWDAPVLIETDDTWDARLPQVAVDRDGNALAVWESTSGVIWSNRYDAATASWGAAVALGDGAGPTVAFDSLGNALAVWGRYASGTVNVWAARYVAGTGWAGAAAIFDVGSSGGAPDLAFDAAGNAWLVALHWNGVRTNVHAMRYRAATDSWDAPVLIESDDRGITQAPQVAIDPSGNAVALWTQFDGTRYDIRASHYALATDTWSTTPLSLTTAAGSGDAPQVGFDGGGDAVAVWAQGDGPFYSIWSNRYTAGAGWGTAERIETGDAGDAAMPQLAVDAAGNAFAVWYQSNGTVNDVWVNRYIAGTGWSTPALLEALDGQALRPQVAVDGSGDAVATWDQFDGTRTSIWAALYR